MNKKKLSERDISTKYIIPAITTAGWDIKTQFFEDFPITKGRITVRGHLHSRAKPRRADYVLFYQDNLPLAVIEAKNNKLSIGQGMQQALNYAESLDVPFVFSSNGDGFLFHDKTGLAEKTETTLTLTEFPSPETLWQKYLVWKQLTESQEKLIESVYYDEGNNHKPRYYQVNAINRTIEAIAKQQQRLLLVMATGTGKTYTAFQIIWRLWKAKSKKRILFLADRNILVDQAKNQDFAPFGDAMTKIENREVNKNFSIYLALYQAVTGNEEDKNIYKQFPPNFFDLIVVDECHRGSADENSAWRDILDYFHTATHLGLTATPKETKDISTTHYFGDAIYTYSLRQGIDDGFLAPYTVIRITTDKDKNNYTPVAGKTDKYGKVIEQRPYSTADFDRNLVLEQRTQLVAVKVWAYLKATDPMAKTIIFCDDQDHAERMRQALVNIIPAAASNRRYVMRITGEDKEGKAELFNFIAVDEDYPIIATTSKLLTTGVDAKTCKLIVLDQNINSMTEFKQIIGRGTRIREDYNKFFFTIMDFKNATRLFADPQFDGEPECVYEDDETSGGGSDNNGSGTGQREKYYLNDITVTVDTETTQYLGANGKLIIGELRDYSKQKLTEQFTSLKDFLNRWTAAERKEKLLAELKDQDIPLDRLQELVPNGEALDMFDLIAHIAFDQKPMTRSERVKHVKTQNYFAAYNEQARAVLDALLEKYAQQGITSIEHPTVLDLPPFDQFGTKSQIRRNIFGGVENYSHALTELEKALYSYTEQKSS